VEKSCVAENFAHAKFVVAGFDGGGMVRDKTEAARGVGCGYGGRVT